MTLHQKEPAVQFKTQDSITDEMDVWLSDNAEGTKAYDLISSASAIIDDLRGELKSAQSELEDARDELREQQNAEDRDSEDIQDAVNALLDCVDRPVGTLKAAVPDTPASQRAIIALFDAANRNL